MAQSLTIRSAAFDHNASIPQEHTGEGRDVSPPLAWSGVPAGTKSLALICDDPDAPSGDWVHWVLYNIPAATTSLSAGAKGIGVAGNNSWPTLGYRGPMPPAGSGSHRYVFTLYALDVLLDLPAGATKPKLLKAMQGHILAQGQVIGKYQR